MLKVDNIIPLWRAVIPNKTPISALRILTMLGKNSWKLAFARNSISLDEYPGSFLVYTHKLSNPLTVTWVVLSSIEDYASRHAVLSFS